MIKVYVSLIKKGIKTIDDVPVKIRDAVMQELKKELLKSIDVSSIPDWENGKTYGMNTFVKHRDKYWKSKVDNNESEPGVFSSYENIWEDVTNLIQ